MPIVPTWELIFANGKTKTFVETDGRIIACTHMQIYIAYIGVRQMLGCTAHEALGNAAALPCREHREVINIAKFIEAYVAHQRPIRCMTIKCHVTLTSCRGW